MRCAGLRLPCDQGLKAFERLLPKAWSEKNTMAGERKMAKARKNGKIRKKILKQGEQKRVLGIQGEDREE